ncbi:MAG: restriction endonuclease subunit S [Corynebacterium sp.]|nr:restriction endonuclease subunit S [Corynebacterium sp.]NWO16720.1 restriction endonuclease subunit S [Corynebacterium sp.]
MMSWNDVRLDEVVELQRGHDLPLKARLEGNVPVLGSNGVVGYHNQPKYPGPGVTIGRSGVIGGATFTDGPYWPLNTCLFVRDFKGNDPRWVYYRLKSIDFTAMDSGSAQPSLNRNYIASYPVSLPPISEQRAIAEALGALDDKIAANNKLARLTNDLADSVFRQALLKAEFSNETFADISRVSGGGTPSTKQPEYWNGDVLWATPTDVSALMAPYLEGTSRTITEEGLNACASELYPAGTILMTSRATIGSFALTQFPTAVNQGFIVVQPTDKNLRYWIFHEMRSRVAEFTAFANGATFLELSRGNFKNFRVRQAPYDVMVKFNETAGSLHKLGRAALVENQTLSSVRDTLLPQLMSGKIRVREAEAVVEDVL